MRSIIIAIVLILAIFGIGYGLDSYDGQVLIPHTEKFAIADKWHEEECTPIYTVDSNGTSTYAGDSCSDKWTLVRLEVLQDGLLSKGRDELEVSGDYFKEIKVGDFVSRSFDVGKLGFVRHDKWEIVKSEAN